MTHYVAITLFFLGSITCTVVGAEDQVSFLELKKQIQSDIDHNHILFETQPSIINSGGKMSVTMPVLYNELFELRNPPMDRLCELLSFEHYISAKSGNASEFWQPYFDRMESILSRAIKDESLYKSVQSEIDELKITDAELYTCGGVNLIYSRYYRTCLANYDPLIEEATHAFAKAQGAELERVCLGRTMIIAFSSGSEKVKGKSKDVKVKLNGVNEFRVTFVAKQPWEAVLLLPLTRDRVCKAYKLERDFRTYRLNNSLTIPAGTYVYILQDSSGKKSDEKIVRLANKGCIPL